jgi:hypothetical protein
MYSKRTTVNQHDYIETLCHLWENMQQKSPENSNLGQLVSTLDLVQCDFFLFSKLMEAEKGRGYTDVAMVEVKL